MRLFNRIEIIGRVTKDPIIREKVTDSGINYRLVWDVAQYQGKNDTAFWSCIMFGDIDYLEKESKKLQRGHMIFVAGQAKKTKKETKTASGAVIYSDSVIVMVREINDFESKPDTSDSNENGSGDGTEATDADIAAVETEPDGDGFKKAESTEDTIPEFNNDEEIPGTNTVATDATDPVAPIPDNTNISISGESEDKTTESTETTVSVDDESESQTEETAVDQNVVEDGGHSRFEC